MQGLLITIATALILAIGGAFAAPFVVDWNTWRTTFEQEASRLSGMPVRIRGRIEAELLPAPTLTLRNVNVGVEDPANEGASGATIQVLKAEFSLGALMRGQWEARGVDLVAPRFRIVIDNAGRLVPPGGPGTSANLSIERISVENGALDVVERAADRTLQISDLDLRGEMRVPTGPLRLEGEAELGGQRHEVRLSLGKAGEEGSRVRFITAPKSSGGGVGADLDGLLRLQDGAPRFEGKGLLTKTGRTPADLPWRLSGPVRLSPDALVSESLEAIVGDEARPLTLAGSARFSFGRSLGLDMVLNGRAADADPVLGAGAPIRSPGEAVTALARLFTDLSPPAFPIRVGAAVDQLTLGGTVVREARLDLTGLPSGWRIDGAEAKLPGQTSVRLSGVPSPAPSTTFAGDLALTSQDPATFLRWAAPQASGDYVAMLSAPVRLSTRLELGAERIAAEALKLSLGPAEIAGRASFAWGNPPRASLDLTLAGLDLDPIIAGLQAGLAATGGRVEGSLAVRGEALRLSSLPVSRMSLAAESAAGGWVLRSLDVEDLAGLKITGHGRFSRLAAPVEGDLALNVSGGGAEGVVPLARLVAGSETGDIMSRLVPIAAPVALASQARWGGSGSEISAEGTLGLLSGRALLARGRTGAPERAEIALTAADAARALTAAGFSDAKPGLGAGRLDLSLIPARAGAARLEGRLAIAETDITGAGTLRTGPDGALDPNLKVKVASPDLASVSTLLSGLSAGPLPARVSFDLSREAGTWRLTDLDGRLGSAPLSGEAALETGGDVPRLSGTLTTQTLSLPTLIGWWGAKSSAQDAATSGWPTGRFAFTQTAPISVALTLSAQHLILTDAYRLGAARLRMSGDGRSLEIRDLSGTFGGGAAAGSFTLRRRGDMLAGDGRLVLEDVGASALFAPLAAAAPPDGKVSLSLDFLGAGASPLLFAQSLSGQGTLGVRDLALPAADPRALAAVLADTAAGAPPDERRTAQMLDRAFQRGPLKLATVEGALSVVNGVARLTPARANVPGGSAVRATFGGSFDMARLLLDISLTLEASEPGGVEAGGVIQWRGPIGNPERRVTAVSLANAIAMRAIERETRRLEERQAPVPAAAPAPTAPAAPPAPSAGSSTAPAVTPTTTPSQATPQQTAPPQTAPPQATPSQATPSPTPPRSGPGPTRPSDARPAPPRAAGGTAPPLAPPQEIQPQTRPQPVRPELDDLPYRAPSVSGFGTVPRPPGAVPGE